MQAEKDEYKYLYFHLLRQQHIGFRPLGRNLDHVKFLLCVKLGLLWLIAGVLPHFSKTRCFYFLLETIFLCLFVCSFLLKCVILGGAGMKQQKPLISPTDEDDGGRCFSLQRIGMGL